MSPTPEVITVTASRHTEWVLLQGSSGYIEFCSPLGGSGSTACIASSVIGALASRGVSPIPPALHFNRSFLGIPCVSADLVQPKGRSVSRRCVIQ